MFDPWRKDSHSIELECMHPSAASRTMSNTYICKAPMMVLSQTLNWRKRRGSSALEYSTLIGRGHCSYQF